MKSKMVIGAALLAGLSGTALAGGADIIHVADDVNDFSTFRQNYANEYNGGSLSGTRINQLLTSTTQTGSSADDSTSGSFTFGALPFGMTNQNFDVDISGQDVGGSADLFIGTTGQLTNRDFNAGNNARPTDNSLFAVAFGNERWNSNTMTFDFDPTGTVTAFGFSYEDIGDVNGSLTVTFVDSVTGDIDDVTITINPGDEADGFMSLVASQGTFIDSITFEQSFGGNQDADDGFIFYNFSTVSTVPLPPAAFAGLGLLGGMAGVRKFRNR